MLIPKLGNVDDDSLPLDDGVTGTLVSPNMHNTTAAGTLLIDTTTSQITDDTAVAIGNLTDTGETV